MRLLPANLGPFGWNHPRFGAGYFRPTAGPRIHGRQRNPAWESGSSLLAARLLVGLSVRGVPLWSPRHVVALVARKWGNDASFVSQVGLWRGKDGRLGEEESLQVAILNTVGLPEAKFKKVMGQLADHLATALQQELVIIEIQRGGLTIATGFATPRRRSR